MMSLTMNITPSLTRRLCGISSEDYVVYVKEDYVGLSRRKTFWYFIITGYVNIDQCLPIKGIITKQIDTIYYNCKTLTCILGRWTF